MNRLAQTHSARTGRGKSWLNGELMPIEEAKVSVLDHGLLYGDGIFEGLRFYGGRPFKLSRHLQRLRQSAQALCLDFGYSDDELAQGVQDCVAGSGLSDGYIRILVTRGEGNLGINPSHCGRATVVILAAEMELVCEDKKRLGLRLITASTKRVTGSGLDCRVKSLNYLHSILAKTEANHAGADDALLLNVQGLVAECSAANIFIVKQGQLFTPPVTDGALEGITRETVIELAESMSLGFLEQSMSPWDIYTADECFISGSAARLLPVASLDGRKLRQINGPVLTALQKAFIQKVSRG